MAGPSQHLTLHVQYTIIYGRCSRSSALTYILIQRSQDTNNVCFAHKTSDPTDKGMLPVWRWWETGLWGSGCEIGANLSVRCGSLGEAHRMMSGSSSSSSGLQSNTIQRPASAAGADPRSPTHTSARFGREKNNFNDEVPITSDDIWDDRHPHQCINSVLGYF